MTKLRFTILLIGKFTIILLLMLCDAAMLSAQQQKHDITLDISMDNPSDHLYHIMLTYKNPRKGVLDFKMPTWTPGFYEIVDFAGAVQHFKAAGTSGKKLSWIKRDSSTWEVRDPTREPITLSYDVRAVEPFIGNINLEEHYGYIIPGALCLYPVGGIKNPVTIQVRPYQKWPQSVATSLDAVQGKPNTFYAADFDVLYDSPLLMGELETFPSFSLQGKPVNFIGYHLGSFDRQQFMNDLSRIVGSGSHIIGDVPFSRYSAG